MQSQTKNLAIEAIIRDSIDVKKLGLTFVGKEYSTPLGRIDILAADGDGNKIPIEIKIGCAGDSAVGQVLGYMQAVGATRGIIMANEFSKRVQATSPSLGIELYPFRFDVIVSGESVVLSPEDIKAIDPDDDDHVQGFIKECCDIGVGTRRYIATNVFMSAYRRWHEDVYRMPASEDQGAITKAAPWAGFQKPSVARVRSEDMGIWTYDDGRERTHINAYKGICLKNTSGLSEVNEMYLSNHWDEIIGNAPAPMDSTPGERDEVVREH